VGTKKLIEDYVEEVTHQLNDFAGDIDSINNHIELRMKTDVLRHLRHSLGNTALLLSGGGSLAIYHVGVAKAIMEAGILPRIIAGSSAGSIIASLLCTRNEEEFLHLTRFEEIHFTFMEAPIGDQSVWSNISAKIKRWFFEHAVYDSEYMESTLKHHLGDLTFLV
jgi:TAG lipase/steryl ester hydrolase/phospholipase A2/LPA acyltransferase